MHIGRPAGDVGLTVDAVRVDLRVSGGNVDEADVHVVAAKRQRVRDTVAQMLRRGDPVTFAAVARAAGVSTWLVYADGVREHIDLAGW